MRHAMRRARRACPANEPCLARDKSSRVFNFARERVSAAAPSTYQAGAVCSQSIAGPPIPPNLRDDDDESPDRKNFAAGGRQFPADQSHSARLDNAVHGMVQPDRAAAGARPVDRPMAAVLRSGPERSREDAVWKPP